MIILVSSKVTQSSIQHSLGKPEYSYFFLLEEFLPALERIAQVISVESASQVDSLYRQYSAGGEAVIFLSVSPPQQTPVGLQCPTVCLFAWEFANAPDQAWEGEPRNDWRHVFQRIAGAIACSRESADAVRQLMGQDYPVAAIPAPVWSRFHDLMPETGWQPLTENRLLQFAGHVIDSPTLGLSASGLVQHMPRPGWTPPASKAEPKPRLRLLSRLYHRTRLMMSRRRAAAAQSAAAAPQECHIELSGVVFSSVLNPRDGRKNWVDIITAFCWAFRDTTDATLVLKMTHHDLEYYRIVVLTLLSRLAPFKCRVLVIHGFLDDQQYRTLITATDFYVNASTGEGLCLPLMEFLAAGKPALAPKHTAMLDYLNEQMACLVHTSVEPACWAHDPHGTLRTYRHRLNWASLMQGYRDCYRLAHHDTASYQRMSHHAWQGLRSFSEVKTVARQLRRFLQPLAGITDPVQEKIGA